MNTAISIPNPLFEASKQLSQKLGMSIEEFCTAALAAYVAGHQTTNVTEKLNKVYESMSSSVDPVIMKFQVSSLGEEQW